ncbi:hypothetical protein BGY98DRAFT_936698 [Russula aff. rugulosa BPL654]|nr:hypothetical protein BGY98DRAFT_936698 [Russula aff. rugulosa BPL654]
MFNEKGEAAVVSTRKGVGAHIFSGQDIEKNWSEDKCWEGVDIQLKILQTLLSFITNFPTILDRLLKNVVEEDPRSFSPMSLNHSSSGRDDTETTRVLGLAARDAFSRTSVCWVTESFAIPTTPQFSSQLETEADLIPATLIKLIKGKADADEPGRGWMWVLAMEIMRGPGVGFVVIPSSRAVSSSITILWQPTVAPAAPLAHASSPESPPSYPPSSSWSPHIPPCSASPLRCTVWVYLRATLNRTFIATQLRQRRGDVGEGCQRDGDDRACLSVKTTVIKVQWKHTFISLACNTPFHFPTASRSFLLTTNLSDSIFGDDLGAMQTLARAAGFLATQLT